MSIKLFGIADWLDELKDRRPVLGELVKQAIDQPLHVLMTFASVWGMAGLSHYLSVWLQSGSLSVAGSTAAGVLVTVVWNALREYEQWPSSRWWDPPLDWTFEAAGIALGAWTWVLLLT